MIEISPQTLSFLKAFSTSCRRTIIEMLKNSQSGHPGGSLSSIDYLSLLYTQIIGTTGENVIVSHGHISPAVYSVLAEMGYIPKDEVIETFRKIGSIYEGHITRHVPGILYGTGPLGVGVSAASGFALAEKLKKSDKKTYVLMGDGELQEGQVYEMTHFASKYTLSNIILFIDDNAVQLTASTKEIMPLNIEKTFDAAGWKVFSVDGHDFEAMWQALQKAQQETEKPVVIVGKTIMGKGVSFMEESGKKHLAAWHGNAPKPEEAEKALEDLQISLEEKETLEQFRKSVIWKPEAPLYEDDFAKSSQIDIGEPILYEAGTSNDCRTAYGKALLDLALRNTDILAITADLRGSVMTKFVAEQLPTQHFDVGIAEQQMVSMAGGLSLSGYIPFISTFGAFMSSRAKDQARVNDINRTNVKMVATHCGLSVGEDGPTHQAIDDAGSFFGMFHTHTIDPADPNHCDRIIRFIASHYGNFYVRMGRHKIPVLTKENGDVFFSTEYEYQYGKCDIYREGKGITLIAIGSMCSEAAKAREILGEDGEMVEVVFASSFTHFDEVLKNSILKTKKIITLEDHNVYSGLGTSVARYILENSLCVEKFEIMGVKEYQLSGTVQDLYKKAKIDAKSVAEKIQMLLV
jgi:transketolase